jgi:hypothetical protein
MMKWKGMVAPVKAGQVYYESRGQGRLEEWGQRWREVARVAKEGGYKRAWWCWRTGGVCTRWEAEDHLWSEGSNSNWSQNSKPLGGFQSEASDSIFESQLEVSV